jgi:hypothetical protein
MWAIKIASDWQELTGGVAQGALLGLLIFLAVIDSAARDNDNRWKYILMISIESIIVQWIISPHQKQP